MTCPFSQRETLNINETVTDTEETLNINEAVTDTDSKNLTLSRGHLCGYLLQKLKEMFSL